MITKGKPRGVPFKKGDDTRRNLAGSSSKEKQDFKAQFRRMFDEEANVRKIVRALLRSAEKGVPWAVQEVLNRGLGKPVQSIETKAEGGTYRILYANQRVDPETGRIIDEAPSYPSLPARPGTPGGHRAEEATLRRLEEEASARRLLEAHDDGRGDGQGDEQDVDYVGACVKAGE